MAKKGFLPLFNSKPILELKKTTELLQNFNLRKQYNNQILF
jgi:hypothetical protein